jgi:aromatic-L-amino-acid decarboxylase
MVLRHFGADGLRDRLAEHMRLAQLFASWVDANPDFERLAPVPFSVVCFRARAHDSDDMDRVNERILEAVNGTGEIFISHTRLDGRYALRLAIGNLHTTESHVMRAWELIQEHARLVRSAN